jgi:hypothetical protein
LSGPRHPQRVTPRGTPEEVVEQFLQGIRIHLATDGIYPMLAGTTFAHSSGVPRVGPAGPGHGRRSRPRSAERRRLCFHSRFRCNRPLYGTHPAP